MTQKQEPRDTAAKKTSSVKNAGSAQNKKLRGKPFQPGNPGRRKGSRNRFSKNIRAQLAQDLPAVLSMLIDKARSGHVQAGIALMHTSIAPARERGEPIIFQLPQLKSPRDSIAALAEIAAGATDGRLNAEDAQALVALVREFRQAFVVENQESRIVALETATQAKTGQGL